MHENKPKVLLFSPLGDELPNDMRIPSDKQDKLHGCLEHLFNQVSDTNAYDVEQGTSLLLPYSLRVRALQDA